MIMPDNSQQTNLELQYLNIIYIIYTYTQMLQLSTNSIHFDYTTDSHLSTIVQLKNRSPKNIYYKFKVNRPRFYLVKPDRGFIMPNESVQINIKLHKEGIGQANADKFKCVWAEVQASEHNMDKFQQRVNTHQEKMYVKVKGMPPGMDISKPTSSAIGGASASSNGFPSQLQSANSGMPSLRNTRYSSTANSLTNTYQSLLQQKQQRVNYLTGQIEMIRKSMRQRNISQSTDPYGYSYDAKKSNGWLGPLLVGVAGLAIGVVTSLWI